MAQQGPARRSVATRVPAVIGLPELVVARHDSRGQGGQAGQEVRRRRRLPPPAHPLQAAPLLARVRLRGLRRAHRPLRPPAHRAPGRARAACRTPRWRRLRLAELATGEAHLPAATVFVMGGVAERHRREVNRSCAGCPSTLSAYRRARVARPPRAHGSAAAPRPRRPAPAAPHPAGRAPAAAPEAPPAGAGRTPRHAEPHPAAAARAHRPGAPAPSGQRE